MFEMVQNGSSFTTGSTPSRLLCPRVTRVKTGQVFSWNTHSTDCCLSRCTCPHQASPDRTLGTNSWTFSEDVLASCRLEMRWGMLYLAASTSALFIFSLIFLKNFWCSLVVYLIPIKGSLFSCTGEGNLCKERLLYSLLCLHHLI